MLKTKLHQIAGDAGNNRDTGNVFLITEMPAVRAEKWAWRAFLALAHAGIEIPEAVTQMGILGVALVGLNAFRNAKFEDMNPLLDEMMTCVHRIENPNKPEIVRPLVDSDTQEVSTLIELRQVILELHAGFTFADALSKLKASVPSGQS